MSAATATSIMQTFGNTISVTLKRVTGATFDPVTGTFTGGTDNQINVLAVIGRVPDRMIDGTRILNGDKMLTISAETQPLETDKVLIKAQEYSIVQIDAPLVNDEILYWRVICRG